MRGCIEAACFVLLPGRAVLACGFLLLGKPTGTLEGVAQYPLDLAVHAAEVVIGPALYRGPHLGVYAQGVLLSLHLNPNLLVNRAGIHYRLSFRITTEYHKQVRNHCGATVLVHVHHMALGKLA